jgi:hypothetical protein
MQGTAAVTVANQVVTLTADKDTEQRLSTRKELGSLLIIVFELLDSGAITLAKRKYQEFMRYLNKHFSLTPEQNKALITSCLIWVSALRPYSNRVISPIQRLGPSSRKSNFPLIKLRLKYVNPQFRSTWH